jgi:charged multivesicular body protein 3
VDHTSTDVDLDREEQKVKLEIKQAAKRGDQKTARILAKQIVQSRRAKERMYKSKAELHSISLALTHQLGTSASSPLRPPEGIAVYVASERLTRSGFVSVTATMKVSGALAKSAAVMQSMNNAIKLPAIQQTMMAMGREMEKVWSSLFAKLPPTALARVLPRRWWWSSTDGAH